MIPTSSVSFQNGLIIQAAKQEVVIPHSPHKKSPNKRTNNEPSPQPTKITRKLFCEDAVPFLTDKALGTQFERAVTLSKTFSEWAIVVQVRNKEYDPPKREALKINDCTPPFQVLEKLNLIWSSKSSIHLTETRLLGKVAVKSGPFLKIDSKDGFVFEAKPDQKKSRFAYVYKMELLEGDLLKLKKKGLTPLEEAVIEVQRVAIEAFLENQGIKPFDLKDINVLYKRVTEEDRFKEKKIIKADFWLYTIGTKKYWVPRIPYLIKLCDFDKWTLHQGPAVDNSHILETRLKYAPHLLKIIKTFENPPATPCKIRAIN